MRVRPIVFLWLLFSVSCSSNECTSPVGRVLTSGRTVLDASVRRTQDGHFYLSGFSFSSGKIIQVTNPNEPLADMHLLMMSGPTGEFTGLAFVGGGMKAEFGNIIRAGDAGEARVVFDSTMCIPDDAYFHSIGGALEAYDVWAVKTVDGKYGKVLITNTFWCKHERDSAGVTVIRQYGEVTFDWVYQPDGTACFE